MTIWTDVALMVGIFIGIVVVITAAAITLHTALDETETKEAKWWVVAIGAPITIPLCAAFALLAGIFIVAEWTYKHGTHGTTKETR